MKVRHLNALWDDFYYHKRLIISASCTTKIGRHDIAEILLKVALNTKNQSIHLVYK
jgi:uncharacterized protein YaiL (DUF2058 family)